MGFALKPLTGVSRSLISTYFLACSNLRIAPTRQWVGFETFCAKSITPGGVLFSALRNSVSSASQRLTFFTLSSPQSRRGTQRLHREAFRLGHRHNAITP